MMSHHARRKILKQICKLSPAYKPFQLSILVVINSVCVAVGGPFAALVVASNLWEKGTIAEFRMDANKQIADLRMDVNKPRISGWT